MRYTVNNDTRLLIWNSPSSYIRIFRNNRKNLAPHSFSFLLYYVPRRAILYVVFFWGISCEDFKQRLATRIYFSQTYSYIVEKIADDMAFLLRYTHILITYICAHTQASWKISSKVPKFSVDCCYFVVRITVLAMHMFVCNTIVSEQSCISE